MFFEANAEAETDSLGNMLLDEYGNFKPTKNTLTWTIHAGETVAFPNYVADILLARYGIEDPTAGRTILTEVTDEEEMSDEREGEGEGEDAAGVEDIADDQSLSQVNTVGGLAFHFGKKIPHTGYKFKWKNLSIEIVDMDGRRIDKVLVKRI